MVKITSSIINARLDKYLSETVGLKKQFGFSSGRGCVDATAALKIALQNLNAADQAASVVFVDLVKAFDSVNREMLWKILARLGVPPQIIKVIQKLYTDVTYHMNVAGKKKSFESTCGVKQGDNLGPILFIFVIQAVSITLDKKWNFQKPNFRWRPFSIIGRPQGSLTGMNYRNKGQSCSQWKSYYVDDAAFLLLNRSDATEASKLIVSHFRRFGLTVHAGVRNTEESSKTEAMYFPAPLKEPAADAIADIELDNNGYFSFTKEFKYLGSTFTPELNDTINVEKRIDQASKAFKAMNPNVFRRKEIPISLRMRTYQAIIMNLALWGCESWALKEEDRSKLETFHHNCLRRMCKWTMWDIAEKRITNEKVRRTAANSTTMESMMEVRRCRWLSKLSIMEKSRSPRQMLGAWCPR